MKVKLKTSWKTDKNVIQKFLFLDDLQDSLRRYSIENNLESSPELIRTNYKHHAEIHDIKIIENNEEKSMLKLFEKFSLIVIPEDKKIKIFITAKNKVDGSHKISRQTTELKGLLNQMEFYQGNFEEIIFCD